MLVCFTLPFIQTVAQSVDDILEIRVEIQENSGALDEIGIVGRCTTFHRGFGVELEELHHRV